MTGNFHAQAIMIFTMVLPTSINSINSLDMFEVNVERVQQHKDHDMSKGADKTSRIDGTLGYLISLYFTQRLPGTTLP
jgi:hypothetical protein